MAYMLMPMYNLDKPVGKFQPNLTDDVKLVQTMLTEIAKIQDDWAPAVPLTPTGIYDDATSAWIVAFQKRIALTVDGKVHPMLVTAPPGRDVKVDWHATFGSGAISSLYAMNVILRQQVVTKHEGLKARLGLGERLKG
jgi:hypothetical protein